MFVSISRVAGSFGGGSVWGKDICCMVGHGDTKSISELCSN